MSIVLDVAVIATSSPKALNVPLVVRGPSSSRNACLPVIACPGAMRGCGAGSVTWSRHTCAAITAGGVGADVGGRRGELEQTPYWTDSSAATSSFSVASLLFG